MNLAHYAAAIVEEGECDEAIDLRAGRTRHGIVVYPDNDFRVAFGAVAPTPFRSERIETALHGKALDEDLVASVVAMVPEEISPITDMRATAEYRTHATKAMLKRGLWAAVERRDGAGPSYGTRLI